MAEIRQSKVNKTLTLSTRHICSATPIYVCARAHVGSYVSLKYPCFRCQIAVQFPPFAFDDFSQASSGDQPLAVLPRCWL